MRQSAVPGRFVFPVAGIRPPFNPPLQSPFLDATIMPVAVVVVVVVVMIVARLPSSGGRFRSSWQLAAKQRIHSITGMRVKLLGLSRIFPFDTRQETESDVRGDFPRGRNGKRDEKISLISGARESRAPAKLSKRKNVSGKSLGEILGRFEEARNESSNSS